MPRPVTDAERDKLFGQVVKFGRPCVTASDLASLDRSRAGLGFCEQLLLIEHRIRCWCYRLFDGDRRA